MRLLNMNGGRLATIAVGLLVLAATSGFAQSTTDSQSPWANPNGPLADSQNAPAAGNGFGPGYANGPGVQQGPMMRSRGNGQQNGRNDERGFGRGVGPGNGMGPGMLGGPMGGIAPMGGFGPGFATANSGTRIAADQIPTIVKGYLARFTGTTYQISKILEFQNDFYVQVTDSGKGKLAFELIVSPYNGGIRPAPMTMAWNTDYGRAQFSLQGNIGEMSVTQATATTSATDYVKKVSANASVGQASQFPGYYSFVVSDNNKTVGIVSVDGFNGQVRYQNWNGGFVKSIQ